MAAALLGEHVGAGHVVAALAVLASVAAIQRTRVEVTGTTPSLVSLSTVSEAAALEQLDLLAQGKVRDIYAVGEDRLLLVTTDRISTYDVVHPTPIPDKGKVLTGLSAFWFERTARGRAPTTSSPTPTCRTRCAAAPCWWSGWRWRRWSAWCAATSPARAGRTTSPAARSAGSSCRAGLQESEQLPEPIFTPATKAEVGDHDENVDFDRAAEILGDRPLLEELRRLSLELYTLGSEHARERGIILADTKFEFGRRADGTIVLGDEALTPDSSRFWPADGYEPGRGQPSLRQAVRARLGVAVGLGQDAARARRCPTTWWRAPARATSRPTRRSPASRSPPGWSAPADEGARAHPPQGGHPRPPGPGRGARAARAGLRGRVRGARGPAGGARGGGRLARCTRCASGCWPTR